VLFSSSLTGQTRDRKSRASQGSAKAQYTGIYMGLNWWTSSTRTDNWDTIPDEKKYEDLFNQTIKLETVFT